MFAFISRQVLKLLPASVCLKVGFAGMFVSPTTISIDDKLAAILPWGWHRMGWNLLWFFANPFLGLPKQVLAMFCIGLRDVVNPQATVDKEMIAPIPGG